MEKLRESRQPTKQAKSRVRSERHLRAVRRDAQHVRLAPRSNLPLRLFRDALYSAPFGQREL